MFPRLVSIRTSGFLASAARAVPQHRTVRVRTRMIFFSMVFPPRWYVFPISIYGKLGSGSTTASFHPETPDVKVAVSDLERRDFLSWQGNQGIARRRTTV